MKNLITILFLILQINLHAQDVTCKVVINSSAIANVDQKIFATLKQSLTNFVNNRKWTNEEFKTEEAIDINFNITLTKKDADADIYEAKLSVQSSRPVFGTDYYSTLLNYVDNSFRFKYVQFQPIDFNENRVTANDVLVSNLSATMAYYIYLAIGLNYDSYKLKGGQEYYTKAQNIVNNAPEGAGITGWKSNESKNKNRYWFVDNLLNTRFVAIREIYYNYHRKGLDQLGTNKANANTVILNTISALSILNSENPGSAIIFLYFNAKGEEYLNIISNTPKDNRASLIPQLALLDVTNATKYNALK